METVEKGPAEPGVLAALVENHRVLLDFLERRVGSRSVAEDLLQEAFVKTLAKGQDGPEPENALAWIYRVLRNAAIDYQRRRAAAGRALTAFAAELEPRTAPEGEVLGEACACVARLAGSLRPEYADALRRIEIDGLAVKDYEAEAGISAGNAGVRIFRARAALRRQVALSCGTCAEHGCLECSCGSPRESAGAPPRVTDPRERGVPRGGPAEGRGGTDDVS